WLESAHARGAGTILRRRSHCDVGNDLTERFPYRGSEEPAVTAEGTDVRQLACVGPATDRTVRDAEQHRDFAGREERVLATVAVLHRDRLPAEPVDETLARPAGVRGLPHIANRPFLPSWGASALATV